MLASENGSTDCVRLLLDAGASTKNPRGMVCVIQVYALMCAQALKDNFYQSNRDSIVAIVYFYDWLECFFLSLFCLLHVHSHERRFHDVVAFAIHIA